MKDPKYLWQRFFEAPYFLWHRFFIVTDGHDRHVVEKKFNW